MQAGGGDDVDARGAGDVREVVDAASHPVGSPLGDRPAAEAGEGAELGGGRGGVVEFLARQPGRADEEVVVGVAHAEVAGGDVAEDRPDPHSSAAATRRPARVFGTPM